MNKEILEKELNDLKEYLNIKLSETERVKESFILLKLECERLMKETIKKKEELKEYLNKN